MYDFKSIEEKWQKKWENDSRLMAVDFHPTKPKFYVLYEFFNISGNLHMGHALDNVLSDIVCRYKRMCGFDVLWLDMEHSAIGIESLLSNMMAARSGGTPAWVRVPWNDPVRVKPVIDMGADGVIFPFIRTAEDARLAVASCTFPPKGIRGYGPLRALDYGRISQAEFVESAYRDCQRIIQIEHIDAVNHLEEIAAIDGIDAFIVGPNDLSASIGKLGQTMDEEMLATATAMPMVPLCKIDYDADYDEDADEGVEVIGVVWPGKKRHNKIYRYDPNGEHVTQGDVVLVPSRDVGSNRDIIRKATVAQGNHKVDPENLVGPLKKIIGVFRNKAEELILPKDSIFGAEAAERSCVNEEASAPAEEAEAEETIPV